MGDAILFIDHIDHVCATHLPGVEGLPARGGIECRAIQVDAPPVFGRLHDACLELPEIAVVIVKALGHAHSYYFQSFCGPWGEWPHLRKRDQAVVRGSATRRTLV